MASLSESQYLRFPFSVGVDGPMTSSRSEHIREQIEQVLFTDIKERVFRPVLAFAGWYSSLIMSPCGIPHSSD